LFFSSIPLHWLCFVSILMHTPQLVAGNSVLLIAMPGCGPVIGSIIQAIQIKRYSQAAQIVRYPIICNSQYP